MPRPTGHGGQAEGDLPKGPSREEALLLEAYDLMEAKARRQPAGLLWQRISIERTERGINVLVSV
jgi:hypothetical protein